MKKALKLITPVISIILALSCDEYEMYLKRGLDGENLYELEVYGESLADGDIKIIELDGFKVEDFRDERVQYYIKRYQTTERRYFQIYLDRANIYLPYIREVFKEAGVPEDLAYLPLIESTFNPAVTSHAGACGMWQFMPRTGLIYGLDVTYWVDERRDPEKSTIAAAKHLSRLYKNFKSWVLALAAYNAGGGRIGRAIRKHKSNIFWELVKKGGIPRETQNYIPKFIATTIIAKNPEKYGFKINTPSITFPNYETVYVDDAADLSIIAKSIDCDTQDLKILNPELRQWITPPGNSHYPLRIPMGKTDTFNNTFAKIPRDERVTFRKHTLRMGETLSHLGAFYNVPTSEIISLNKIQNAKRINLGRVLLIPIRGLDNAKQIDMKDYNKRLQEAKEGKYVYFKNLQKPDYDYKDIIYCVKEGDTLWEIAIRFGVSVDEIQAWNKLGRHSYVKAGDELFLRLNKSNKK